MGWRGRGARVSDFFLLRIQISNIFFWGGWGRGEARVGGGGWGGGSSK